MGPESVDVGAVLPDQMSKVSYAFGQTADFLLGGDPTRLSIEPVRNVFCELVIVLCLCGEFSVELCN